MIYLNEGIFPERVSYLEDRCHGIHLDLTPGAYPLLDTQYYDICYKKMSQYFDTHPSTSYLPLGAESIYTRFKEALLRKYHQFDLDLESIVIGYASFGVIEKIFAKVLKRGKLLGVGPQYPEIPYEFTVLPGNTYASVYSSDDVSVYEDLILEKLDAYDGSDIVALYLDNPNNPTGKTMNTKILKQIIDLCQKKDIFVLVDEAYGDFMPLEKSAIQFVQEYTNLLVAKSLSKSYGLPNERIGYAVGHPSLMKYVSHAFIPYEPSQSSLLLGTYLLEASLDVELSATPQQTYLSKQKKLFLQHLDKTSSSYSYSLTDLAVPILFLKGPQLYSDFLSHGIKTIPGSYFQQTHPCVSNDFCRITVPSDQKDFATLLSFFDSKLT